MTQPLGSEAHCPPGLAHPTCDSEALSLPSKATVSYLLPVLSFCLCKQHVVIAAQRLYSFRSLFLLCVLLWCSGPRSLPWRLQLKHHLRDVSLGNPLWFPWLLSILITLVSLVVFAFKALITLRNCRVHLFACLLLGCPSACNVTFRITNTYFLPHPQFAARGGTQ